ncbi:DegT/DnrJ/EryC1/StrS family aminotransferase [Pleomorphochaeta sp. DL1XJH-081]|uniref:DegT/DnrJ/EryC1/StrS family aminotransferase n=1 Tax=Pleomorphochaeta sp. DL1XJH-081 TaxID=3409690 RepID=UPI003BB80BF1
MEFRDLKHQYQVLKPRIDDSVNQVMTECNFIGGLQVRTLEAKLADYVGVKHCISCGNGTDALTMMLMAWGIGKGDAVFVPDFTFFASGEVVSFLGATPVFVDVDQNTFNMDPNSLEQAIIAVKEEGELKPKVVMPVDLFGLPCDYDRINEISHRYGLKVLEDAAQGFGGEYKGRKTCSLGDAATTSFFPAKPLGCYGDGGAIFTNDDQEAEYLCSIAVHGKGTFKYDNVRIGWNSRLDTLQAAILLVKFDALEEFELESINTIASLYTKDLRDMVKTPEIPNGLYSSWAQYTIQVKDEIQRTILQNELANHGVPSMIYYPKPMHLQSAFHGNKNWVDLSISESLCKTVLSLPIHPYMSNSELNRVTEIIGKSNG